MASKAGSWLRHWFRPSKGVSAPQGVTPPHATEEPIALPLLLLEAEQLSKQLTAGPHGKRQKGDGEAFWQFRPYQAGEPAQNIDWRQSARLAGGMSGQGAFVVRQREAENTSRLQLWVDCSPSMNWRSAETLPLKSTVALKGALVLGSAALRAGERVKGGSGLWLGGTGSAPPRLLERLGQDLRQATPPSNSQANQPNAAFWAGQGARLLVSDFMIGDQAFAQLLQQAQRAPGKVTFLCVLDPAERALPWQGTTRMLSLEEGQAGEESLLLPSVEQEAAAYQALMKRHLADQAAQAKAAGVQFVIQSTALPLLPALLKVQAWLGQQGKGKVS
ncbi:DUF58 domain-containing protein [Formicincola oecophyllae]|uniref:DUF58 domain-containing protein n=1 Tax=Formicincola oecophyllae TaxID=2558361 RepID=UPI0019D227F6|nr:DUF58 domain-containing protein [Formicincola oecophyllae]